MPKYKSKPHEIDAFQFVSRGTKPEKWFKQAHEEGRVSITINSKSEHITIYDDDGNFRKAYVGDWICRDDSGQIFPLTHKSFFLKFEETCEKN